MPTKSNSKKSVDTVNNSKKVTDKKLTAKTIPTKEVTTKKTPTKEVTAKKTPTKKVVEKKVVEKKTASKKVVEKKTPVKKVVQKKTPVKKTQEGGDDVETDKVLKTNKTNKSGKVVRSFKVQLPGNEEYSGRFTGSMPYQAASKALSKYYRTNNNPKSTITFTIKESTRGSGRNHYTYEGHRVKLDKPVEYSIAGGSTITKAYKNHLKKVKKADLHKEENL